MYGKRVQVLLATWKEVPLGTAAVTEFLGLKGAVAVWHGSNCEEISHIQEQRRTPSKMVGGAKSCLESTPIPARNAQRAQTNLVQTRPQRPHRD